MAPLSWFSTERAPFSSNQPSDSSIVVFELADLAKHSSLTLRLQEHLVVSVDLLDKFFIRDEILIGVSHFFE